MDSNRPVVTSAARDPQIPIDEKSLTWVEIRITSKYLAYVLIASDDAVQTDLVTDKGRFTVQPAREQWFSATKRVGDVSGADAITWAVVRVLEDNPTGRAALISTIEGADGLAESSGVATPALVGPSGAVLWPSTSLPRGVTTFEWTSKSGYLWQLSSAQAGSTLSTVAWSTNDGTNNPDTTATTLPGAFGEEGQALELTKVANPSFSYVFDDYV